GHADPGQPGLLAAGGEARQCRDRVAQRDPDRDLHHHSSSTVAIGSSGPTTAPTSTLCRSTPARGAATLVSIFMASSTATSCPDSTVAPSSTSQSASAPGAGGSTAA